MFYAMYMYARYFRFSSNSFEFLILISYLTWTVASYKIWENKIWANEVTHDHKWVNMSKKGFTQDYLIVTFVGIWLYSCGCR